MKQGGREWLNGYGIRCNKCLTYFEDDDSIPEWDDEGFPICPNCKTDMYLIDHPRYYDQRWHNEGPEGFWMYKDCQYGKDCIESPEHLVDRLLDYDNELQDDLGRWVAENPKKVTYQILHTHKTDQIIDNILPKFLKWLGKQGKLPVPGKDYHDAEWVPLTN